MKNRNIQSDNPYPIQTGHPCNAAERANDRLAEHAKEAVRIFVARTVGVDPSEVRFPDQDDFDHFVELLTGLRHFARHMVLDYRRADRLAHRRHDEQYVAEHPTMEK